MKKLVTILSLLGATNVYALDVQLESGQSVTLEELAEAGAQQVTCEDMGPRCILLDTKVGIQYPGQAFEDVVLDNKYNDDAAIDYVRKLKDENLCK